MFKRFFLILTAIYFLAGNVLLPQGDFAALAELPNMYRHCQTTEDPDMTVLDFITEHLLNLDGGAEDKDDIDEHELPHSPVPFHTTVAGTFYFIQEPAIISFKPVQQIALTQPEYHSPYFSRVNTHKIFQPPKV
jgi:hypothetical protein